jgi:hypothetical protein
VIGQRINNYEIRSVLGEGGMGAVYLAEHPMIARQVAVKVLHPSFAREPEMVARFINEAKAANAIGHPGIVDVLDVGTLPDQTPYLIMELLKGEGLEARLERVGRLPVAAALDFAKQAASALAAAHAAGIVHRDLKPANLFVTQDREDPARERLKVLDFGIAKLLRGLEGNQVKTGTGAVMGTPAYMSPEQSLGRSAEVDHRTDIYALGVILHRMLAGATPFQAEGGGEMMMLHVTTPPPPLGSLNPEVSAELEALVLRALAKKPEDRFQSMAELRQEVMAIIDPRSVPTVRAMGREAPAARVAVEAPIAQLRRPPDAAMFTTLSSTASQVGRHEGAPVKRRRPWLALGGAGVAAAAAIGVLVTRAGSPSRSETRTMEPAAVSATKPPARPAVVPAPAVTPAPLDRPTAAAPAAAPAAAAVKAPAEAAADDAVPAHRSAVPSSHGSRRRAAKDKERGKPAAPMVPGATTAPAPAVTPVAAPAPPAEGATAGPKTTPAIKMKRW